MQPSRSLSVSELKNRLLEVVRQVEKGEVFEITKGGEPVALLTPRTHPRRPATGFARVQIEGALELPEQGWTYDASNLRGPKKRRRR
jgi:prevent-host-death family protein